MPQPLLPPIFNGLVARVAQGIGRRVIELDEHAQTLIAPLAGRVIKIHVVPLDLQLFVFTEHNSIVVLDEFDGEVDASVTGRPTQFVDVLRSGGTASAVRKAGLTLEGDLELVESCAAIVQSLDPDIEEYVSRFLGDGPARKLGVAAQRFRRWFDTTSQQVTEDAGYYLREDSGLLVTAEELAEFSDDVDELRADTDRLEQRVAGLHRAQPEESL